ncbi:MAG: hypothetical protein WD359_04570 [Dehalococcoidia bacterium]
MFNLRSDNPLYKFHLFRGLRELKGINGKGVPVVKISAPETKFNETFCKWLDENPDPLRSRRIDDDGVTPEVVRVNDERVDPNGLG